MGRRRVGPPLVAAIASVLAVGLVGSINRSPLQPVQPASAAPMAPMRFVARALGLDALGTTTQAAVAIVVMAAAAAAFLYALRAAWRGELGVRLVTRVGIAFVAFAVALPLLLSRDVYAYSVYGRIASLHHANPYVATPHDFRHDPMYRLVGPEWRGTTAVYGPAFMLLAAGLTRWLHGPVALIWAFKLMAGAGAIATILLVARLSSRLWPSRAAFATVLVAWNPVVLFHDVGGGHNDTFVGLAVVAALWLLTGQRDRVGADGARGASPRRELLATAVLALGALVKATAAIPLVLAIVASVWRRPRGSRARWLAAHGAVVAGFAAAFAAPFFQLHDPTFGLASLASHEGWLAPTRFFRVVLGHVGHAVAGGAGMTVLQTLVRVAMPAAFVVSFAAIVRAVARRSALASVDPVALGRAWGWALLVALLCAPVLWPWYVVWVLPLTWVFTRTPRIGTVVASTTLAVSQTVAAAVLFPSIFRWSLFVGHYVLTPVLIGVLVALLRELRGRLRSGGVGLFDEPPPAPEQQRAVAAAGGEG